MPLQKHKTLQSECFVFLEARSYPHAPLPRRGIMTVMKNRYCCKKCAKCFTREEKFANINERHHCGEFFHVDWRYKKGLAAKELSKE